MHTSPYLSFARSWCPTQLSDFSHHNSTTQHIIHCFAECHNVRRQAFILQKQTVLSKSFSVQLNPSIENIPSWDSEISLLIHSLHIHQIHIRSLGEATFMENTVLLQCSNQLARRELHTRFW